MQAKSTSSTPDSRWALRVLQGDSSDVTLFASRTGAEAAAKQMAQTNVAAGRSAVIVIYNADGSTDAQFVY